MSHQKVLIAGQWRESKNPVDHFNAVNPSNKQTIEAMYPVSGEQEILEAIEAAWDMAFREASDVDEEDDSAETSSTKDVSEETGSGEEE